MKIIFIGSQGTGKTSVLNHFKNDYTTIENIVRDLVAEGSIKINEKGNEQSQDAIFRAYLKALNEYEDYISSRGLFDVVAYTQYLYTKGQIDNPSTVINQVNSLEQFVSDNPDIVYVYFPIEFDIVADGVRSVDKRYQRDIDKTLVNMLNRLKVPYYTIHGTVEERVKFIEDLIQKIETRGVRRNKIK